jgi:hypothetical protein
MTSQQYANQQQYANPQQQFGQQQLVQPNPNQVYYNQPPPQEGQNCMQLLKRGLKFSVFITSPGLITLGVLSIFLGSKPSVISIFLGIYVMFIYQYL